MHKGVLFLAAAIVLGGCKGESTGPDDTPVATISLTPENALMSGGATKQLVATLRDANGAAIEGREITWTSSNPDRATVTSTGLVTASAVDAPVVITASIDGISATVAIEILTFVRISSGTAFSCGLIASGTAYCWGSNEAGQLGDGTTTSRLLPTRVATAEKFVAIASGVAHSCAITIEGIPHCWGLNDSGQAGSGPAGIKTSPQLVPGGLRFVSIAGSVNNTCATTSEREVYCWGYIQTFIDDGFGGRVTVARQFEPLASGSGMIAVTAGADGRYCSVDGLAKAYCWHAQFLMLKSGVTIPPAERGLVSATLRFTTLRVGNQHVCGLIESGAAYCWGKNFYGQLGDGTTIDRDEPVAVAGGLLFESLAAGGDWQTEDSQMASFPAGFTCGITTGGKAYCWGSNRYGQLGIGSQAHNVLTPQAVTGNVLFTNIRGSSDHACGLARTGAAYCWGGNGTGALGNESTTSANRPTLVFGD